MFQSLCQFVTFQQLRQNQSIYQHANQTNQNKQTNIQTSKQRRKDQEWVIYAIVHTCEYNNTSYLKFVWVSTVLIQKKKKYTATSPYQTHLGRTILSIVKECPLFIIFFGSIKKCLDYGSFLDINYVMKLKVFPQCKLVSQIFAYLYNMNNMF